MKVQIDCDKRLKERGGTEYEGGWFYATLKDVGEGHPPSFDMKNERFGSYSEAKTAAIAAGHEVNNAGWKRKLLMWNWHSHSLDGYPGWEQATVEYGRPCPAFAKLTHVSEEGPQSSDLCNEWDDIAEVDFYQRDWTDDGIPWVSKGETYWSGWWFATIAERDRFLRWYDERSKK